MNELSQRTLIALQAGHGPVVLGLAALALVGLGVLAWRSARGVGPGRRAALIALRTSAAIVLVLLALRPVLRRESLATTSIPVAVLVDASSSMEVRDQDGATRLARVGEWVRTADTIERLDAATTVDWFAASDGAVRATSRQEVANGTLAASGGTDLLGSLRALDERYPGQGRPAVILLSDGADHGELRRLLAAGEDIRPHVSGDRPIHAVAPQAGQLADLAVDLVAHDPVAFLRTPLTARVRVRSTGLPEAEVPVSLLRGDQVVTVKSVKVGGSASAAAEATFTLEPPQVGEALYWIRVPVQAGEAVAANNEASFAVRVVRDRLRVLQVVGRPSWDGRFLRELLKRDPAIDLISFFILRNAWDDTNASVDELSLIPFPVSELFEQKLAGFDLVVFQNFDFAPYGIQPHLSQLRRHVEERGGGLVVVGGDLAFGADYRDPSLRALLPVELSDTVAWSGRSVGVAVTEVGRRHPILRLGMDDVPAELARLQPLRGLNTGVSPSPSAQVLLRAADGAHEPLLVAGEVGEGRVLVLASDGSWRWSLPSVGRGRSPRAYERFWENALRWLVRDPRSALVVLEADRRSIGPGEPTEIRAHVRTESYGVEPQVEVTFAVRDGHGTLLREERARTGDDGVARLTLDPAEVGSYSVTVASPRGEAGPVFVERLDPGGEMRDTAVDEATLRALAEATGGRVRRLSDRGDDLPVDVAREVRVQAVEVVPLWRTWPAWLLAAGLLCVEWWLRRRWGLA